MTIDVEALLAESVADEGQRCMTCRWVASRPEEEQKKWLDALDQPKTWAATQVARAMKAAAEKIGDDSAPLPPTAGSVLNHRGKHKRMLDGGSKRQR